MHHALYRNIQRRLRPTKTNQPEKGSESSTCYGCFFRAHRDKTWGSFACYSTFSIVIAGLYLTKYDISFEQNTTVNCEDFVMK